MRAEPHCAEKEKRSYIASIVPTPEYYAKHRHSASREFCYGGDKGRFSGFVMYRSLDGILVAIDNYRDGQLTRHDYFPQVTEQNADSVQRVALLTTGDLTLQAGTPAAFKLGTEEDPWCADAITVCGQQTDRPPIIIWIPGSGPGWLPDPGELPDYPNPGPGPSGGGGGGSGSGPDVSVSVPQVQQKDCGGAAGANAASAQATLGTFNNAGLGAFVNEHIGESVEWGATLNYNSQTGQYSMANQKTDGAAHSITQKWNTGVESSVALVHTHPNTGMGPSIADVNALVIADKATGNTKTSFVVVNENGNAVTYALQLENSTQAYAFQDNYKANPQLSSMLTKEIDMVFQELNKKSGDAMGNSYSYALSAILQKYNTGVRVLKQEGNAFKQKDCTISGDNINRSTCK